MSPAGQTAFPPSILRIRHTSPRRWTTDGLLFLLMLAGIVLLHLSLLRLPYFWDEAGYYIPAARDLWQDGSLIPHSTISNAHPPLVMIWLALAWKLSGYSPLVTRVAMSVVSAFALLGVFRLSRQVANTSVAVATTTATALFPVFFAQSTMAHLDMAAAAFTLWGLASYLRDHRLLATLFFSLAALSKETAILTPLALLLWELAAQLLPGLRKRREQLTVFPGRRSTGSLYLLLPLLPLVLWFAYHHLRTGFTFGNPYFLTYNLTSTLQPLRIAAAFLMRLWQLFGYMSMLVLTVATVLAMTRPALPEPGSAAQTARGNGHPKTLRARIEIPVQLAFAVVIAVHMVALSLVGGAVLARYLLPVYPLVILIGISTLRRRLPWWPVFVAVVCLAFGIALVVNPPYHFAPEDNLAYADFVLLHQAGDGFVSAHLSRARVLTAWPASDELSRPYLGYVARPLSVIPIENFTQEELDRATEQHLPFDAALLFSTKYEPAHSLTLPFWSNVQTRFFGYHRDLEPEAAAQLLQGRVVFERHLGGQWIAVVEMDRVEDARLGPARLSPARLSPAPPALAPSRRPSRTSSP